MKHKPHQNSQDIDRKITALEQALAELKRKKETPTTNDAPCEAEQQSALNVTFKEAVHFLKKHTYDYSTKWSLDSNNQYYVIHPTLQDPMARGAKIKMFRKDKGFYERVKGTSVYLKTSDDKFINVLNLTKQVSNILDNMPIIPSLERTKLFILLKKIHIDLSNMKYHHDEDPYLKKLFNTNANKELYLNTVLQKVDNVLYRKTPDDDFEIHPHWRVKDIDEKYFDINGDDWDYPALLKAVNLDVYAVWPYKDSPALGDHVPRID